MRTLFFKAIMINIRKYHVLKNSYFCVIVTKSLNRDTLNAKQKRFLKSL